MYRGKKLLKLVWEGVVTMLYVIKMMLNCTHVLERDAGGGVWIDTFKVPHFIDNIQFSTPTGGCERPCMHNTYGSSFKLGLQEVVQCIAKQIY
jgi:hypothetical protein